MEAIRLKLHKIPGDKTSFSQHLNNRLGAFFDALKPGAYEITVRKDTKPKTENQVKMIFGLMIQSTIEQAEYLGIGVEDLLVYLMDGNIPKGVGLNKDFLHALMYEVCPTFDDEGRRVTLSKMNTKQAADLFERYRNLLAPLGIVIQDPDPNWRNK
jgi:hypothetical protein